MQLRSHQAELSSHLQRVDRDDFPLSILTWVVPGGGKSWLPGIVSQQFPGMKIAWFVPRVALRDQACRSMKDGFGIPLRESDNTPDPSRDLHGFVATQQSLTSMPDLYVHELRRQPYILVTDELHHAKIKPDGSMNELGAALNQIAPLARIHLMMTGTLETNDRCKIWGCEYADGTGLDVVSPETSADIYIRYNRRSAIVEGAIVPIEFHHVDGTAKYIDGNGNKEVTLSIAKGRERSAALFTALKTELASSLLDAGISHWESHGDRLVVVCAYQSDAKEHAKALSRRGLRVSLAISDEGQEALHAIKQFREGRTKILVTCAMCYEGLDIPPITHIVCLTHIRSIPWIEQMLARAWRSYGGKYKCWAFVPEDTEMMAVISRIRQEEPAPIPLTSINGTSSGNGAGGSPASIIPLHSSIENIRSELLDTMIAPGMIRTRVIDAFRGLGLPENDPLVEQMVKRLLDTRSQAMPASPSLTPTEEMTRIRKGIHSMLNAKDASEDIQFGTRMKELNKRMGYVKFENMTLEQLRYAAKIAHDICA